MKNSFCEWPFITLIHYFLTTWDVEKHSSHASSPCLHFLVIAHFRLIKLACEQALWGALAAGWEKEGELRTTSLEFAFHLQFPCGSPSPELSDFGQSAWSGNEREHKKKHWKTCAKGNDVITNLISANQHFALTFLVQIFKFQSCSCKLPFLFPPRRHSHRELARRLLLNPNSKLSISTKQTVGDSPA